MYNVGIDLIKENTPIVDVIVCVHNALDDVKECLNSLIAKKTMEFNLIIINDGSNLETLTYLNSFSKEWNALLISYANSRGYTKSANEGLKSSKGDYVILLNSDTIVTKFWIEKLLKCANADGETGIVGPLSNCATWQSVPQMKDESGFILNTLPQGMNIEFMSLLIEWVTLNKFPQVPFVNGFCYMIKREVLNKIGYLDEAVFPIGYGEEDDYSLRAADAGFKLRVADNCYVFHMKTRSFTSDRRDQLCIDGGKALFNKHGNIKLSRSLAVAIDNETMENNRMRIKAAINEFSFLNILKVKPLLIWLEEEVLNYEFIVDEIISFMELGIKIKLALPKEHCDNFTKYNSFKEDFCIFYEDKEDIHKLINDKFDYIIKLETNSQNLNKKELSINKKSATYYISKNNPWLICTYTKDEKSNLLRRSVWQKINFIKSNFNSEIQKENKEENKKKIVVYTAITGGYDKLKDPKTICDECDYICFTDDSSLKSDIWKFEKIEKYEDDNYRTAIRYKILPHLFLKDYEYSIWVDGSLRITGDINEFIKEELGNEKMAFFKHSLRNCIYDEARETIQYFNYSVKDTRVILKQVGKYVLENYPPHNGLIESGTIIRRHNEVEVVHVMENWWSEYISFSKRDQLSFNYVAWKLNAQYKSIDKSIFDNKYLMYYGHENSNTNVNYDVVEVSKPKVFSNIGPINKSTDFLQETYSILPDLAGINLYVATYRKKITTPYKFILKENEVVIREVYLDIDNIKDNSFFSIYFSPIQSSKDKIYTFTIIPATENVDTPITLGLGMLCDEFLKYGIEGYKNSSEKVIFHTLLYKPLLGL